MDCPEDKEQGNNRSLEECVVDTLQLLSHSLRGVIVAPPGKKLFVADYASIEARVLLWCAQDEDGLQKFRDGVDLYCDMASSIYNRTITKEHKTERQLGKTAILGLGYQMGAKKFHATCLLQGIEIDEALAERTVTAYREKYWRVRKLWYDMETAAGEATYDKPGTEYTCGPTKWFVEGRFLYCQLPSGRKLAYPDPKIKTMPTSWGAMKQSLTYMGMNATTRKWHRQTSYGGLLVENCVQAISRDCLAEALKRCEASKVYLPVLSVHDEIICEAHEHLGQLEEFDALVAQVPEWAPGLPIATEAFAARRYRK